MSHTRNRAGQPQQQYGRNRGPQVYQGEHSGQNFNRNMEYPRESRYESQGMQNSAGQEIGEQDWYGAQKGYRQMHYPQNEQESDYSYGGEYIQDDSEFRAGQRARYNRSSSSMGRPSFAGRGPQGYRRSDERITEDINEQLTQDHMVDATGISVETRNGEVTLKGTVTDRESKRRAEEIAEYCSGVKDVQNQLRIQRNDSQESNSEANRERSDEKRNKPN